MIFSLPPVRAQTNKKIVVVSALRDAMALPPIRPHIGGEGLSANVSGFIVGIGDVKECATAVQRAIERLDGDISTFFAKRWSDPAKADEPVPPAEQEYFVRWKRFVADFGVWKLGSVDACSDTNVPAVLALEGCFPGPLYDDCSSWNDRANGWYDSFKNNWGGVPSGPKNVEVRQPSTVPDLSFSGISNAIPWTPLIIGASVVGALVYFRPKILGMNR